MPYQQQEEENKNKEEEKNQGQIIQDAASKDEKLIIYFHGNAEDLGNN